MYIYNYIYICAGPYEPYMHICNSKHLRDCLHVRTWNTFKDSLHNLLHIDSKHCFVGEPP